VKNLIHLQNLPPIYVTPVNFIRFFAVATHNRLYWTCEGCHLEALERWA